MKTNDKNKMNYITTDLQVKEVLELMDEQDKLFFDKLMNNKRDIMQEDFENCVICSSNLTIFETPLKCGHRFHSECIEEWFKRSKNCPTCKAKHE
jgi:hypothetical protein